MASIPEMMKQMLEGHKRQEGIYRGMPPAAGTDQMADAVCTDIACTGKGLIQSPNITTFVIGVGRLFM